MDSVRRSMSKKEVPSTHHLYIREIKRIWLQEPPTITVPISINETKMVYKMTLGTLYYDSAIRRRQDKNIETVTAKQAFLYLKVKYPTLSKMWIKLKNETSHHLDHIAHLWTNYILNSVERIIDQLVNEYPGLVRYRPHERPTDNYYVEENIKESVYQEIQHYIAVGYRLGFFRIDETRTRIGNGYTYVKSSNAELLERFIQEINRIIYNQSVLDEFKIAETRKSEIESQVLKFKNEIKSL